MLVSTLEAVPGREVIAVLGVVQGSTVRAKHLGKDILAGFKNIVGGELRSYTDLLQEARQEALNRMITQAKGLGADAILGVRFASAAVAAGAAELLCYGTAVSLR